MEAERLRDGIPIDDGVWQRLAALAQERHVPLPWQMQGRPVHALLADGDVGIKV